MKLDILKLFKERQVIVNTFIDDELRNKDGFMFDHIEILDRSVNFVKDEQTVHSISLEIYPTFQALDDFKNYFSFSNDNNDKIEIYFP